MKSSQWGIDISPSIPRSLQKKVNARPEAARETGPAPIEIASPPSRCDGDVEAILEGEKIRPLIYKLLLLSIDTSGQDKAPITKRHPPVRRCQRADSALRKGRIGRCLMIAAHLFIIGVLIRAEGKTKLRLPLTALTTLK